ncbi:MAG: alpha-1,2-fucosyltransferase [Dysgonomonas sp.]
MIINYDSPGQLCNRIWSLVPSIAYGLEHREKVFLVNFYEYLDYFEDLNKHKLVSFTSKIIFKRIIHSLKVRGYIENGRPNIFSRLLRWNMIEGWTVRLDNSENVQKQADIIRDIFRFNNKITSSVDKIFSSLEDTIVIGVHIRRGDYRTWREGIYFYSDENYISLMRQLKKQLAINGRDVKFLLCSNELIDLANFRELDCFVIPESSGEKDLYALSKCSYIIGPPSTYSQWASFTGKVPMKFIMSPEEEIKLSDLSLVLSLDRFDNNKEFSF